MFSLLDVWHTLLSLKTKFQNLLLIAGQGIAGYKFHIVCLYKKRHNSDDRIGPWKKGKNLSEDSLHKHSHFSFFSVRKRLLFCNSSN